eukprot:55973_1
MAVLLVLVILTQRVMAQNTNACVWGRDVMLNTEINGEFIFQGTFNEAPWYKKEYESGTTTLYLFKCQNGQTEDKYCIGVEEPAQGANAYVYCMSVTSYPWECDQWQLPEPGIGYEMDPDVSCQMGPCPEWNCDQIKTNINYKGCDTFSVKVDTNTWSNTNDDRFFYFNYLGFNWICNDEVIYKATSDDILAFAERTWIENTMGNSVSIHFTTPFDQTQEIQCIQRPTNAPTQRPTNAPTQQPTNIPTVSPSSYPTIQPTVHPSQYPSKIPTVAPTQIPTYYPSIIPSIDLTNVHTMKPTKNPLVISTILTTLHSNTVASEGHAADGVDLGLYIAIIGGFMCVCCSCCVFGLFLFIIRILKSKAESNHAMVELPQPHNNALIPPGKAQSMETIEMEVIDHPNELKQWFENSVHLAVYYQMFVDAGYLTLEHVELIMNETHLMEIGVGVKTHRVQILKEIQNLRDDGHENNEGEVGRNTIEGRVEINTIGGSVTEQQIDDDFIVVGDDD